MKATHPPVCGYSEDTEILTRRGWMRFAHLTYMDEVGTRSPDGRFEWQHPEKITVTPYEGEMVWFHGRSLNVLLAPATPVLHKSDARGPQRIDAAGYVLAQAPRRATSAPQVR